MNGILIINKPEKYTSHDIVYKIKKILNEKVGHTGTLDPLATGVLPLLVGKATKISKYLINHDKIYEAQIKLGIKTDTLDREGNIIEERKVENLTEEKIDEVIKSFIGKQVQKPPIYSAIKLNGKKLYEYAREGQKVDVPTREIEIYNIELNFINKKDNIIGITVYSSKGTYIRSLCQDVAEKLGTVGFMYALNRIQVRRFQYIKFNNNKRNRR